MRRTDKPLVLVRPGDIEMFRIGQEPPGETRLCPVTVVERVSLGWLVRYRLQCDDGVCINWAVSRDDDDKHVNLSLQDRVYIHIKPATLMATTREEIDYSVKT